MYLVWVAPVALGLFVALVAGQRFGWTIGRRRLERFGERANEGLGAVEAATFGLMGLVLAFAFNGAAQRFDNRRDLIVQEVNAIGTAYLRLDLLPDDARDKVRDLFRQYLDQRIATYRNVSDREATAQALAQSASLRTRIWDELMIALRNHPSISAPALLPPVNETFDIAETRYRATLQHPPPAIQWMLVILVLISAFLGGFGMAKAERESRLHMVGFAAITTMALYLIFDLEYPRLGFVRVDSFDQALYDLRASME